MVDMVAVHMVELAWVVAQEVGMVDARMVVEVASVEAWEVAATRMMEGS